MGRQDDKTVDISSRKIRSGIKRRIEERRLVRREVVFNGIRHTVDIMFTVIYHGVRYLVGYRDDEENILIMRITTRLNSSQEIDQFLPVQPDDFLLPLVECLVDLLAESRDEDEDVKKEMFKYPGQDFLYLDDQRTVRHIGRSFYNAAEMAVYRRFDLQWIGKVGNVFLTVLGFFALLFGSGSLELSMPHNFFYVTIFKKTLIFTANHVRALAGLFCAVIGIWTFLRLKRKKATRALAPFYIFLMVMTNVIFFSVSIIPIARFALEPYIREHSLVRHEVDEQTGLIKPSPSTYCELEGNVLRISLMQKQIGKMMDIYGVEYYRDHLYVTPEYSGRYVRPELYPFSFSSDRPGYLEAYLPDLEKEQTFAVLVVYDRYYSVEDMEVHLDPIMRIFAGEHPWNWYQMLLGIKAEPSALFHHFERFRDNLGTDDPFVLAFWEIYRRADMFLLPLFAAFLLCSGIGMFLEIWLRSVRTEGAIVYDFRISDLLVVPDELSPGEGGNNAPGKTVGDGGGRDMPDNILSLAELSRRKNEK